MKRPYGSEIKLDKFIAEMSIVYATSLEIFGQIMNKHNKKKKTDVVFMLELFHQCKEIFTNNFDPSIW